MEKQRDIVLFLGAGFSRDAGLPLMSEFAMMSAASQPYLAAHAAAKFEEERFRHAAPLLMDAKRTFEGFQRLCATSGILPETEWGNLETIFGVAEALHQAGVERLEIDDQPYALSAILRDLQTWTWKTYQQLPVELRRPPEQIGMTKEPYIRLFSTLCQPELADRFAVVTTNYDIVCEYYCWKHGIPAWYPFDWDLGFGAGHGHEPYVFWENANHRGPPICKLHGSVNYFEDLEAADGTISIASDLGDGRDIGRTGGKRYENEPAILALDALWNIRKKYGEGFTPAIIPPSFAKLRRKPWLTKIWNHAIRSLRDAQHVIFLGYSLPPSDGFMTALISGAAATRSLMEPPHVYVVNPCGGAQKRFKHVFGESVVALKMHFEEAMAGELQGILAAAAGIDA